MSPGALLAGLALAAAAQQAQPDAGAASLAAEAVAVTLDVVVLDGAGRPVTGLAPEDFEVFEDGRAQAIVGFEERRLTAPVAEPGARSAGITNVGAAADTGRVLALLIDDLGITPATMQQVVPALSRWIRDETQERDEITIVTTSADHWWSDAAGRGRDELVATLQGITGMLVVETPDAWRLRAEAAYGTIGRLAEGLSAFAGPKAILFVSERFADDRSIDAPYREAVAAARRANAAVYFQPARGLLGTFTYTAENPRYQRGEWNLAGVARSEIELSLAGGRNLAEATGGAVTISNDLAAGLERMARENAAFYLVGYQPARAPDGQRHELKVKVARDGVEVRARRSYRDARPEERPQGAGWSPRLEGALGREMAPALLAGSVRPGLPLRLAVHLDRPTGDRATVQFVIEIDNSRVHVNRSRTPWRALLDLTVMAARVGEAPILPVDERLDLSLAPGDVGNGWWMLSREAPLPPGEWQIRAWVRDLGSGESGLLSEHLSVPAVEQGYLSTLRLSDRATAPGASARIVPQALRRFGKRGDIVCQYEVFNFGGQGVAGLARLEGGYVLQREGDSRARIVPPTPIARAGRRAVRRILLPLRELEDGRYTISVTVRDALAQRTLVARESFVVARE